MEQAAGGRRPIGGAGPGVGREEEGGQLAAAPGLSLSSLVALVAALMLSIAASAASDAAAVESAAVAFATVFEVSLVAGLVPRPWPWRALPPQYCR